MRLSKFFALSLLVLLARGAEAQDCAKEKTTADAVRCLERKIVELKRNIEDMSAIPKGAVVAFRSIECPQGWRPADGKDGRPDLRGRVALGAGPLPQGGGEIYVGSGGGSHKLRIGVARNEAKCCDGDRTIWGAVIEWQGEGSTGVTSSGNEESGSPHFDFGEWLNHLPPYAGLLYCLKEN